MKTYPPEWKPVHPNENLSTRMKICPPEWNLSTRMKPIHPNETYPPEWNLSTRMKPIHPNEIIVEYKNYEKLIFWVASF